MYIDGSLHFKESELGSIPVSEIMDLLTFKNPEYVTAQRFASKWTLNKIPEFLCFCEKSEHTGYDYKIPRNALELDANTEIIPTIPRLNNSVSFGFIGKLRPYQAAFNDEYSILKKEYSDQVIVMPCGHGKTTWLLWYASIIKKRTLVVLPTNKLAKQWLSRINEFTTATFKLFTSDDGNLNDVVLAPKCDIYIITLDLLSSRKETLTSSFYSFFEHVVFDEGHNLGAQSYHPIISKFPAPYRTCLTATFRRADSMHLMLQYHFGRICKMENQLPLVNTVKVDTGIVVNCLVEIPFKNSGFVVSYLDTNNIEYSISGKIYNVDISKKFVEEELKKKHIPAVSKFLKDCLAYIKSPSFSRIETYCAENSVMRRYLISHIKNLLKKGRKILVIGKRLSILQRLHEILKEQGFRAALMTGDTQNDYSEIQLLQEIDVILGSESLVKEGLDIDNLDTLICINPIKDTEQALGRIARISPLKKEPVAYIYCPSCEPMQGLYMASRKYIKLNGKFGKPLTIKEAINE